ncbi:uncharacterized protein UBRO_06473 [Ustilago bromivora]|uniref:Uncharacterized protein n=1 Tax=Ustilago bromivora TaxID=307758 RepID=A0A1K0H7I5_9BASI|nr:uncharacterized protein UBRO_06473 [Ustilago bromivora]SYW83701.1 uncharacterized protein UBRO2_05257 [Ustilago bromivora]
MWSPLASASLVFLILYFILFLFLAYLYVLRKVPLLSRWFVLLLHVTVRLASQGCGLSFGIVGYANIDLLVAYFILGAEGYFTLVVCTLRFLIAWQRNHWGGLSWLEPNDPSRERGGWRKRFSRMFQWKHSRGSSSLKAVIIVDWLLVGANTIIISGGSLSSAAYTDKELSPSQVRSRLDASKALRAAGQAIFLAVNMALLACVAITIHQHRHHRYSNTQVEVVSDTPAPEKAQELPAEESRRRPWFGHATLLLLLATWPFLAIRGAFGVAQAIVPDLNYFNSEVYDANNLTAQFVTEETCFVTMMEFISAAILATSYFTTRTRSSAISRA